MRSPPRASDLVLKCFNAAELDYLNAKPEFVRAILEVLSLNDFDKVTELGQHLLDLQDEPIREALILRPSSRPAPNLQGRQRSPASPCGAAELLQLGVSAVAVAKALAKVHPPMRPLGSLVLYHKGQGTFPNVHPEPYRA